MRRKFLLFSTSFSFLSQPLWNFFLLCCGMYVPVFCVVFVVENENRDECATRQAGRQTYAFVISSPAIVASRVLTYYFNLLITPDDIWSYLFTYLPPWYLSCAFLVCLFPKVAVEREYWRLQLMLDCLFLFFEEPDF